MNPNSLKKIYLKVRKNQFYTLLFAFLAIASIYLLVLVSSRQVFDYTSDKEITV